MLPDLAADPGVCEPCSSQVAPVDREFDDPLPPDARNLDAVFYHDTVWMKVDRANSADDRVFWWALAEGQMLEQLCR